MCETGEVTRRALLASVAAPLVAGPLKPPASPPAVELLPFEEGWPVCSALPDQLPAHWRNSDPASIRAGWAAWLGEKNATIRERLARGEQDTLVNFLLFGVSFTAQPRVTPEDFTLIERQGRTLEDVISARIDDLLAGLRRPGGNERLAFLARQFAALGYAGGDERRLAQARQYLLKEVARALSEQRRYASLIEEAKRTRDASGLFAFRSSLYRDRGISLDTSFAPCFAIEQALREVRLPEESISRVAVIGPGLDFADKLGGYDIYPQQTLQPFALLDSLLRLKLATAGNLYLLAFDVSDRVIYHLETARKLAAASQAYRINVPLDSSVPRSDLLLSYWTQFGDRIAKPAEPLPSLAQRKEPRSRAIAVHPDIVALVMPVNLNVVTHRPAGHWKGSFDLAVATNVLVYYSVLDQSLALANLQTMLRPGGLFLCHNSLLELPVLQMHSARVTAVEYSTRADDGDFVVHYLRPQSAARPQ